MSARRGPGSAPVRTPGLEKGRPPGFRYGDGVSSDPAAVPDIDPEEGRRLVEGGAFSSTCARTTSGRRGMHPMPSIWPWGWSPTGSTRSPPTGRWSVCAGSGEGPVRWPPPWPVPDFDVRNVAGGMLAWEAAGLPVVTDGGGAGRII